MNIEAVIKEYLSSKLAVLVSVTVPSNRPEKFVTIERTGGPLEYVVMDHATLAIQSWAKTPYEASELANEVDSTMQNLNLPNITKVERNSIYNFPDTQKARYQGVYEVIFYKENNNEQFR